MGGVGSGNHDRRHHKKETVERCITLGVDDLRRQGALVAGESATDTLVWNYASGGKFRVHYEVDLTDDYQPLVRLSYAWVWTLSRQKESANYIVRLTTTAQRFGGVRWWFLCPLLVQHRPCNRRVGKLHLPPL